MRGRGWQQARCGARLSDGHHDHPGLEILGLAGRFPTSFFLSLSVSPHTSSPCPKVSPPSIFLWTTTLVLCVTSRSDSLRMSWRGLSLCNIDVYWLVVPH
jgi:hypothetical protein